MPNESHYIAVDAALARAYNAAPKTQQRQARKKMQETLRSALQSIRAARSTLLSKKETALFLVINRTWPEEQKRRFEQLNEKRLNESLSQPEFSELESLIRELEQIGVQRLQAVIELARLRKVEPSDLIKQLELEPLVQISQS